MKVAFRRAYQVSNLWRILSLFTGMVCCCTTLLGQSNEKHEREIKISPDEAAPEAKQWLQDAVGTPKKVTWYKQTSGGTENLEAKFFWNGHLYSVEFDLEGNIENIEDLVKWSELPKETRTTINSFMESGFSKYKIRKVQVQYTGNSEKLKSVFSDSIDKALVIKYEIEYRGKNEEADALWESLFDAEGNHLERSKVILRPVDNINF